VSFDVYLVHASEDVEVAGALSTALRERGMTVWFNSFIVGPSIRAQMEEGLAKSDFGVVLLSPRFFAKRWTREELDALFSLEQPGDIRILPVWHEVDEATVRAHSPMLVMRSAALLEGDVDSVADRLVESIGSLAAQRSPSRSRRFEIATELQWHQGPTFLPASLRHYDEEFSTEFGVAELARHPHVPERGSSPNVVPLMEVVRAPRMWDGRLLTLIGKQPPPSLQVVEEILPAEYLPKQDGAPLNMGLVSYVFQLTSIDFEDGETCYVQCFGYYDRATLGWGPRPLDPGWLCWVTGYVVAYGAVPTTRGRIGNAIYVLAKSIWLTPPVETRDSGPE
jgi:hypothetical protein